MFCPECGSKNVDEAVFCGVCGAAIMEEEMQQVQQQPNQQTFQTTAQPVKQSTQQYQDMNQNSPMQQQLIQQQTSNIQPRKPMTLRSKIILITAIVLVVLVGGLYSIGKNLSKPEKMASKYFEKVMAGNWDEVYEYYEVDDSVFLVKDQFLKAVENNVTNKIANYKVLANKDNFKDNISTTISFEYRLTGESDSLFYDVNLIKQKKKQFLFFDTWKISPDEMIVKDYALYVPKGTNVTFDGITLTETDKDINYDNEFQDSYIIKALYAGEHVVKVTQDNMEDLVENLSIYDSYGQYYLDSMVLKQNIMEEVASQAPVLLDTLYQAAINNKSYSEVSNLFSSNEDIQRDMENTFNNLKDSLRSDDGTGVISVTFNDIITDMEQYNREGQPSIIVYLDYSYDYVYKTKNWWTGDIYEESNNSSSTASFEFIYQDGKWLLSYVNLNSIYY